jgi:hypothetical protein
MKLGVFIALAMCLLSSIAFANPSLAEQAAARSRARDHERAIELYRKAYEAESNPALLVRIAHEHRLAGDARQALAYFCSYIYVDAAGELADEASKHARAIAAQLGNPTDSDHEACETKAKAAPAAPTGSIDMLSDVIVRKPPRITKREIAGITLLGGSLGALALALLESGTINDIREEIAANAPGTDLDTLRDRKSSAEVRQKLWLGAGGIVMITGGILYVTGRADRKRAEAAYVAPTLMKNGGGLVYGRKF